CAIAVGASPGPASCGPGRSTVSSLLDDLRDGAGPDGAAALANREAQPLVHGDRLDERDLHDGVVAGHAHLHAVRELDVPRHVGGAEVELRAVALEERRVPAALVLGEHVDLGLELRVRRDRAGLGQHLAALDVLTLDAAQQGPRVVAGLTAVELLGEHLDAGDDSIVGLRVDADDLDLLADLGLALLDAARDEGAAA